MENKMINLTSGLPGYMNIKDLWEGLGTFVQNRVEDNKKYNGKYPLNIRKQQMVALDALVDAIKETHEHFTEKD